MARMHSVVDLIVLLDGEIVSVVESERPISKQYEDCKFGLISFDSKDRTT